MFFKLLALLVLSQTAWATGTLQVDSIKNTAGSGAPDFPNGLTGSKTISTTSSSQLRIEFVNFGGPFPNTGCSSDPCTIANQSGGISAVNRSGTGDYIVHFSPSFAAVPACSFSISSDTNSNPSVRSPSTSQVNAHDNNGTANFDAAGTVICIGVN